MHNRSYTTGVVPKRIKIFLILILVSAQKLHTQSKKWAIYEVDAVVSLKLPLTVYEIDTIIEHTKFYQIYSKTPSSLFIAQKLYVGKLFANIETPALPQNPEELKKYYLDTAEILIEMNSYRSEDEKLIKKNDLDGYKGTYKDIDGNEVQQTHLYLINKNLYSFSYFNENGIDTIESNTFFNAIAFNNEVELFQYPVKRWSLQRKIFLILVPILFVSFLFRQILKR
jgi:hypothetical protein